MFYGTINSNVTSVTKEDQKWRDQFK